MAIIHDVSTTMKVVLTQTELMDQDGTSKGTRKNSGQKKYTALNNSDHPPVVCPADEFATRLADMLKCLYYGYRVDPLQVVAPPSVETKDASAITAISATLNGRVTGSGSTIGFQIGTTRECGSGSVVATGSPTGAQTTPKAATYAWAGLTTKTKYYFRAFAQNTATGNTQYGQVRTFTTL